MTEVLTQQGEQASHGASIIELSAGIAVAGDRMHTHEAAMQALDGAYDGLLERQSGGDLVSVGLEAQILSDLGTSARRVGYEHSDAMPADLRVAAAAEVVQLHFGALAQELGAQHAEMSFEQLSDAVAGRAQDAVRLLSMGAEEREAYMVARATYIQEREAFGQAEQERLTMQAERRERFAGLGRAAMSGMVRVRTRAREAQQAVAARVVTAGMQAGERAREWYERQSPGGQRLIRNTATGVAVAGLTGYVAMRLGGMYHSMSGQNMLLASEHAPVPNHVGTGSVPNHIGGVAQTVVPEHIGGRGPAVPNHIGAHGAGVPNYIGMHAVAPEQVGARGPAVPEFIGAKPAVVTTSAELFTSAERLPELPQAITVGHWNAQNQDGSLWGISGQLLRRAGMEPNATHIDMLADALQPQAQPNGYLLEGQQLDLRPALRLMEQLQQAA